MQWAKFYDKNYVESLIDKCEAFEADAEVLIAVLERRVNFHKISLEQKEAFAAASGTEPTRKVTTAKPFNLSQVGDSAFQTTISVFRIINSKPA